MTDRTRVLVAYGTKYGSTAEIAAHIGDTLREAGLPVDVRAAGKVRSLDPYRAVVLGSAVYMGRWRRDASRLLRRPELRDLDVWLFSSGPVGEEDRDHAEVDRWTRPPKVDHLAEKIDAHDHVGFGGMVADDAGFMRKRMARGIPPELRDLRDWTLIEAWARSIATALGRDASAASEPRPR
jgi:menaquinone-dependent protoporphyrinogen oxidase